MCFHIINYILVLYMILSSLFPQQFHNIYISSFTGIIPGHCTFKSNHEIAWLKTWMIQRMKAWVETWMHFGSIRQKSLILVLIIPKLNKFDFNIKVSSYLFVKGSSRMGNWVYRVAPGHNGGKYWSQQLSRPKTWPTAAFYHYWAVVWTAPVL